MVLVFTAVIRGGASPALGPWLHAGHRQTDKPQMHGKLRCFGMWCACVLPVKVLLRCSAKLFICTFASLILALSLVPFTVGALTAQADANRDLPAPSPTATLLFVAGCAMFATAVAGYCIAASPVRPQNSLARRSLCLMILLTIAALLLSLLATSIAFARAGLIRGGLQACPIYSAWHAAQVVPESATSNSIFVGQDFVDAAGGDWLQNSLFEALKGAFKLTYEECEPTVYSTSLVRAACSRLSPDSACARHTRPSHGFLIVPT